MAQTEVVERRHHQRVDVRATAILERGGQRARYLVQNLSAHGALLTGTDDVADATPLDLELELPGRDRVSVRAKVLRRAPAAGDMVALAVAFRHRSPDTEDAIQQAVLEALEEAHRSEPFYKDAEYYER
jgi:hypothetical protein